jgi:hypothetical protein
LSEDIKAPEIASSGSDSSMVAGEHRATMTSTREGRYSWTRVMDLNSTLISNCRARPCKGGAPCSALRDSTNASGTAIFPALARNSGTAIAIPSVLWGDAI